MKDFLREREDVDVAGCDEFLALSHLDLQLLVAEEILGSVGVDCDDPVARSLSFDLDFTISYYEHVVRYNQIFLENLTLLAVRLTYPSLGERPSHQLGPDLRHY